VIPLDVGHGEPELPGGLSGVVDGQDVRMLELGGELDLPLEALRTEGGGELRMEHFQCDGPVVSEIVCEKYGGHAATPNLALDAVAVGQGGLQAVGGGVGQLEGPYQRYS
jgi:hypothetical protein